MESLSQRRGALHPPLADFFLTGRLDNLASSCEIRRTIAHPAICSKTQ